MVPLDVVAIYAVPVVAVFLIGSFLYTFIRGEFSWQVNRNKDQIEKHKKSDEEGR